MHLQHDWQRTMRATVLLALLVTIIAITSAWSLWGSSDDGQKETEEHGARSPHEKFDDRHYKDGEHHDEIDHEVSAL